jgi:hypothetical protein
MERTTWTDERLDDMVGEVRELRREMRDGFESTNRRIDALASELRGEFRGDVVDLRSDFRSLRLTLLRLGGGIIVGLVGVIAAILTRGV